MPLLGNHTSDSLLKWRRPNTSTECVLPCTLSYLHVSEELKLISDLHPQRCPSLQLKYVRKNDLDVVADLCFKC